jgi:hypothetical protein
MEIQDGFIVGIFNYCDRWCERCAFTSRCGLFADVAEMEASLDPNLKPVADAPPLPEDVPPPLPQRMQELIAEANEACRNAPSGAEWERMRPRVPPEHKPIDARAKDYATCTYQWLTANENLRDGARGNACDVISWFHFMIASKTNRALTKWPGDDDCEDAAFDCDGSAKVALLAIEESHAAWLDLLEHGLISRREADAFIADLVWLGEQLEHVRPNARRFVRPAFDEPEAVAKLLGGDGRR